PAGWEPALHPLLPFEFRHDEIAIHPGDEIEGNLFRADGLALSVHRAAAEVLLHDLDHSENPLVALRLALRKEPEMGDLGRREKLGCAVWTLGHTGTALNA